ncbi:hypothetical protein FPSE_05818 [Fusarium pseudograminearum CS3096]|uniref:Uncharacterized protein n=1 Tax=Fusarium pseudograminearum (strain CS3096) TaxID=1028729 RepID=K3VIC1_FUSPC|nr:hypothetical protein FPSE_05818 [Fusarium pseudograminearum CS3096]EKJ74044.1 hypothetical protein FPSE_05818 [Fusarium pseudograminearum CS3096]
MSSSILPPAWYGLAMSYKSEGYLIIYITPYKRLPGPNWRSLPVDTFKRGVGAVSYVMRDSIQKEIYDLEVYLFGNKAEVEGRWREIKSAQRQWLYVMYPVGFDTSKIDPKYWGSPDDPNMTGSQMRLLEIQRNLFKLIFKANTQDNALQAKVFMAVQKAVQEIEEFEAGAADSDNQADDSQESEV